MKKPRTTAKKPRTTAQKLWNLMVFQVNPRQFKKWEVIDYLDFWCCLSLLGKASIRKKAYWLKKLYFTWLIL